MTAKKEPAGRLSRRGFLRAAGAGAVIASSAGILASCSAGVGGTAGSGSVQNLVLLTNEWNSVMSDAATRAAKVLGLGYGESSFNTDDTVAFKQAQDAVIRGADLLLLQPADGSAVPAVARLARQNEAYLSVMINAAPWTSPFEYGPNYVWFVTLQEDVNHYEASKTLVAEVARRGNGTGTILHVSGFPGSPIDNQRTKAVEKALAEYPGVRLLGSQPGKWSPEGGQEATESLIARFGVPNGIIAQNDGSLTGVLAGLAGLKLTPGKDVLLSGADGASDILRAIRDGKVLATSFTSPAYFGVAAVARLYDALHGYEFTAPERQMGVTGFTANAANIDGVLARYVDTDRLPFDPRLMSRVASGVDWDPQTGLAPLRVDDYYDSQGAPKPDGYQYPTEYKQALDSGLLDVIAKEYVAANKIRLDDFSYKGIVE